MMDHGKHYSQQFEQETWVMSQLRTVLIMHLFSIRHLITKQEMYILQTHDQLTIYLAL